MYRFGWIKGTLIGVRLTLGKIGAIRKPYLKIKIPCLKQPFFLRPKTSDFPVFDQVFLNKEYDIETGTKAPRFIFDGGSNIGLFALLMKNRYPDSTIVCVEPDPENFALLQKNVAQYDGIYCENCGLWDKDTRLRIHDKYGTGKWGLVVEELPKPVGGGVMSLLSMVYALLEKKTPLMEVSLRCQ
jgi:hypothetical protein